MDSKSVSSETLNEHINKKNILRGYIFIQMILHFLAFKTLNKYPYNFVEYLSIYSALFYNFIGYISMLLNNKNKKIIYYYCMATTMLSFFFIIDLSYLYNNKISYNYGQIIVLFIILDITFRILTQNIGKRLLYNYIIIILWTIGIVLAIFKIDLYMLIYQIIFLIISISPIMFLIYNYKKIKNYGGHLLSMFLLITLVNILFLSSGLFVPGLGNGESNYGFYIYLNAIELFLSYLILSALGFWNLIKNKKYKINRDILFISIFIVGYLYFSGEYLKINIFSIFSLIMILKQSQLLDYYIKSINNNNSLKNRLENNNLFDNIIKNNISDFKKEELYREQVADFLHDEILQDTIYIKKELLDYYKIPSNEKILKVIDEMINTTRGQMNLYKPYINYNWNLMQNYYNLIKSLKNRFNINNILIDFVCDDQLFLSSPYDVIVYRMIHELVTNIFKHSKGEYSIVELKVDNNIINLNVLNYGDYLCNKDIINTESRGLKIIKREANKLGGTLDINSSIDSNVLIDEENSDESVVNIEIKIPIKGEITYANFINR